MSKEARLCFSLGILKHFIDNSLNLSREKHQITGYELLSPLLDAVAYNTYLETIGNKADILYLRCKESITEMTTYSYLDYMKRLSFKFDWKNKEIMLAFDYTDEDFYGDVQGFDIHGWTKKQGITGKFKFLTCSIISDDIPQKIPLISVPIKLGHYKSHVINYCLEHIKEIVGKISLIIFDRGFYDKDLMYELQQNKFPYLIFVPKQKDKKEILYPLEKDEHIVTYWEKEVKKNKTKFTFDTMLVFLKEIYSKKCDKEFDWVFATNVEEVALGDIISTYRKRWRIETQFRVQDDATIKCKSKEIKIRYFIFLFEQLLQTQWVCFYKNEVSFKQFIINMHTMSKKWCKIPNKS